MLLDKLFGLGWKLYATIEESRRSITADQYAMLERAYAAFHGLSSVSDVASHLNEPRFCNRPDTMPLGTTMCKWPSQQITWSVLQSLQGLGMVEAATEAFARWARVSGVVPVFQPDNQSAMIVIGTRRIDGSAGVLAESELPCGNVRQCHQWYDIGEQWKIFDGPGQGIDLVRVMTHELGHALGMNHIGTGNLLAPIYSQTVFVPQAGDIAEMQARYGPTTPTPSDGNYVIRFDNGKLQVDGYRLTRLV